MNDQEIKYAGVETIESVINMTNNALSGKADSEHEHNYAGSESGGGAALVSQSMIGVTTSGTGSAYTAQVPGITRLTNGIGFIMIPHTESTSVSPTLNVNGLGARTIDRMSTVRTNISGSGLYANWLASGVPVLVILYGASWTVMGMPKVYANDLTNHVSVEHGGTGATSASGALQNLGAVSRSGDTMSGNLQIQSELYPSLVLKPTYNDTTNQTIFEGSYAGASSFASWEDTSGDNRRMLEVRTAVASPDLDNAAVLRDVVDGNYFTYRLYHDGMNSAVPLLKGGTGATDAAGALANLGVYSKDEVDALLETVGGTHISYSTEDLVAGESPLGEGEVYLVFE